MKAFILLVLTCFSVNAVGCGSVSQNMMSYWSLDDISEKEEFLIKQSYHQVLNYSPRRSDPIIVNVLIDAMRVGINNRIIGKTIDSFNCLYGAYFTKEYQIINEFILKNGMESVCNKDRLNSSYVIRSEGGVNLRSAPTTSSEKIGILAEGVLVLILKVESEWAYVESYEGKGYIYLPLLKPLNNI
jgi:hypothetical protein